MCWTSLAEYAYAYAGTGDRDEKFLANIFLRENISSTSKSELPYYSVDMQSCASIVALVAHNTH